MDNYGYIRSNCSMPAPRCSSCAAATQSAAPCTSPCSSRSQCAQMHLYPAVSPVSVIPSCGGGCQHYTPPITQNTVVVNQPVASTKPTATVGANQLEEGRPWTTGLCGCFERCGSCLCGFCCLPVFACYLSDQLGESFWGPVCCCNYLVALRTRQRSLYSIKGSVCRDTLAMVCCPCCAVTQMYREMKNAAAAGI